MIVLPLTETENVVLCSIKAILNCNVQDLWPIIAPPARYRYETFTVKTSTLLPNAL